VKLGFDRARARELQWVFTNEKIPARAREHVMDSFFGFAEALGVRERVVSWDIPLPPDALEYAQKLIPDERPTLVISPCSSHSLRNWRAERYAAVADYAARQHGMRVILCGGPTALERDRRAIEAAAQTPCQSDWRDTLPQMLALLERATLLVAPTRPAQWPPWCARGVGFMPQRTPRSGPTFAAWCVNAYPEAARRFRRCPPERLPWTEKIEVRGVMDLITVEQVTAKLDQALRYAQRLGPA
jgi:heptosyltransferase I